MNQKNNNRKGLALLLAGQLLTTAPLWLKRFSPAGKEDFWEEFLMGFGVVLMLASIAIIFRKKRKEVPKG